MTLQVLSDYANSFPDDRHLQHWSSLIIDARGIPAPIHEPPAGVEVRERGEGWDMTDAPAPMVSVVVPAYNAATFLERAIAGVLRQTMGDIEVWVIDDGSKDATAEVAARLGSDRRIRLVARPHGGASAARNEGIRRSRGRYIAFLDADDEWVDPDKLAAQVGLLEANPEVGLSFTDWRFGTGPQEIGEPRLRTLGFYRDEEATPFPSPIAIRDLNRPGFGFSTATVVVRARCIDAVGAFDEQLRM